MLALFLVLGEVAARLAGFVDRVNPFPRHLYAATAVEDLPYRLRPGVTLEVRGSRVEVNERGMRERRDVASRPAPDVDRVLVLGDSVAFGWLQDVERAFPRQLERRLDAAGGGRHEVLNAGVPGYNAATEAAWFREYGADLAPGTVIVAVNLNDHDTTPHLNALGILSTSDDRVSPLSPASWSELYLALRWGLLLARGDPRVAAQRGEAAPEARKPDEWDRFDLYVSRLRKRFYHDPGEPQWGEMRRAWLDLARRARERGIRLLFVLFPDGDQVGIADPDLAPQERLLAFCAEAGLECLDLTPAFRASSQGTALFSDIMHPSDAGHALAADVVARYLGR